MLQSHGKKNKEKKQQYGTNTETNIQATGTE
jgi:hypothetical protein